MQLATYIKKREPKPDGEGGFAPEDFEVLRGLSKSEIDRVITAGVVRSIRGGKVIFWKGDIGNELFLILKGKIHIVDEYDDHKKILAELGPGEFFGEMGVFEKAHTRSTHALAKESSKVLMLKGDVLSRLIDKKMSKQFLKNIIGVLCHRIRVNNAMYMRARYHDKSPKDVKWVD